MKLAPLTLTMLLLSLVCGQALAQELAGDSTAGESLFDRHCSVCHSLTSNRVGPILSGVYGRKAGTVPQFNYSKAVQSSNIVWNDKTLERWLTNPQEFLPGQRMNVSISDPEKRADIIAYLKSISATGPKTQ